MVCPQDYETPAGKTKKTFTYGRAGRDWNQYRMPIVVESRIGKDTVVTEVDAQRIMCFSGDSLAVVL